MLIALLCIENTTVFDLKMRVQISLTPPKGSGKSGKWKALQTGRLQGFPFICNGLKGFQQYKKRE